MAGFDRTCVVCKRTRAPAEFVLVEVRVTGAAGTASVYWPSCPGPCEQVARSRAASYVGPIEKAAHGMPA